MAGHVTYGIPAGPSHKSEPVHHPTFHIAYIVGYVSIWHEIEEKVDPLHNSLHQNKVDIAPLPGLPAYTMQAIQQKRNSHSL